MKKSIVLLMVLAAFVFTTHSLTRAAEVIKLKAANYLPVTHLCLSSRVVLRRGEEAYKWPGGDCVPSRGHASQPGQDV
jgi:hypothetical protein